MTQYKGVFIAMVGMMALQGCAMAIPGDFATEAGRSRLTQPTVSAEQGSSGAGVRRWPAHDRRTAAPVGVPFR